MIGLSPVYGNAPAFDNTAPPSPLVRGALDRLRASSISAHLEREFMDAAIEA